MDPEVRVASDWSTETEKSRLGSDFNFTFLTETEWLQFSMVFKHFQWGLILFCFCFILYHFVLFCFVCLIRCFILFFSHFVMILLGSGKTGKKSPSLFVSIFPPELSLVGWGDADWWEF